MGGRGYQIRDIAPSMVFLRDTPLGYGAAQRPPGPWGRSRRVRVGDDDPGPIDLVVAGHPAGAPADEGSGAGEHRLPGI